MHDIEAMAAEVDAHRRDPSVLPTRESLAVLQLVAIGLTQEQAARRLGISTRHAKLRLHQAVARLGAHTTTHAVAIAIGRGLIPGADT